MENPDPILKDEEEEEQEDYDEAAGPGAQELEDEEGEIEEIIDEETAALEQEFSGEASATEVDEYSLETEEESPNEPILHGVLHKPRVSLDPRASSATSHRVQIDNEVQTRTLPGLRSMSKSSKKSDSVSRSRVSTNTNESVDDDATSAESVKLEKKSFGNRSKSFRRAAEDDLAFQEFMDEALENSKANQRAKVQLGKEAMKNLEEIFKNEDKQGFFLESVLAACHLKDLTTRYGTKAKNVRQFFLEAVDDDTKLAVFGPGQAQAVQEAMQSLGRRKSHHKLKTSVTKLNTDEVDMDVNLDDSECSITEKSEAPAAPESLVGVWGEKKNFWDGLDKNESESNDQSGRPCVSDQEPLVELYGPKGKQVGSGDVESKQTVVPIEDDLEEFPDKYLQTGVQGVNQSEAIRRLWEIINTELRIFNAVDPLTYEMFGMLYDEVRKFVELPEEEIIALNNGHWEPEPLDERKILDMEPFERLLTRFSVYQKALCFLAQHFETLTPIFGDIKHAYEEVFEKGEKETLEVEKEQMEELELRKTLGNHVRQTDKEGHRLLNEKKAEAHALQEHIQWQHHTFHTVLGMLHKIRSSLKLTNWAVRQLKNMQKTKIEALAREIMNTEGQGAFEMALPGKYTEIMQRIRDSSDPKLIRRMLLSVRRQLRAAHKKIVIFEADYADTIPKTDFEIPQKKFNILTKKNETLTDACNVLKAERAHRKQAITSLKSEIYETGGLVKDLERKPTPRPSWTKISNEWPGGSNKFAQIREGQSTRQIINKVVEELSGKKVGEVTDYIKPLGMDESVPIYLRYDKPLLMRSFTANEATNFIKDIWKKRSEVVGLYRKIKQARRDEEEGLASFPDDLPYEYPEVGTCAEFVYNYLKKRCHLEQVRMEWIYNILQACDRFPNDPKMSQFKGVLDGFIDESVYHLFQIELERIRDFMYARSNDFLNPNKGFLEWPDVMKHITNLCQHKTEEQITAINNLGAKTYGVRGNWAVVRVEGLFEPDDDGRESDFAEMLYQQFEEERKLYIRDIYMEILTELGISEKLLEHQDDPVWQTDVSMHMFYACVLSVDPDLPDTTLINYMAWVFMRVTGLPGVASLSTRLIEFLKARTNISEAELEKYNDEEDLEFENCIREIRDYEEDDSTMDKLDLKKRRLTTRKLKFASLRQVMDGLNNGPFVRVGQRVIKLKPADTEGDGEVKEKEEKKRRHRHRHRHRKQHQEKKDAKLEEEEDGDFDDGADFMD